MFRKRADKVVVKCDRYVSAIIIFFLIFTKNMINCFVQ